MKKITILSLHLNYGGIEKAVTSLANNLVSDFEVEIISVYHLVKQPAFSIKPQVKIKYLLPEDIVPNKEEIKKSIKSFNIFKLFKELIKSLHILRMRRKKTIEAIQRCDADIIISTRDIFNEWLSKYGDDNKIRIGWEHNHFQDEKYFNRIVNSVKALDGFVVVSQQLQQAYSDALQDTNCQVAFIPNILDHYSNVVSSLTAKKLISVGRLSHEKGYLDLIKIFKLVHQQRPDWTLEIIGDGNQREMIEISIAENNLTNAVVLSGFKDTPYIEEQLMNSSIYVMTSFTESFGIVLIEAMNFGLPLVAFDSAEGANELIVSDHNGYLIPNRNQQSMVEHLIKLIDDQDLRALLGKNGKEICKKYTADYVIKQWQALIKEIQL